MSIRIVITGGTFDKQYDEIKGELTFGNTHLPEILSFVRCTVPITCEVCQLIDSLRMVDSDRARILDVCRESREDRIIITHGTDTMTETAAYIGKENLDKTVVLTGAMVPYSVSSSDAVFNLGCSISAVQLLPAGVYICMNGKIFNWQSVQKDRKAGVFIEK